jgi:hypothetical protein
MVHRPVELAPFHGSSRSVLSGGGSVRPKTLRPPVPSVDVKLGHGQGSASCVWLCSMGHFSSHLTLLLDSYVPRLRDDNLGQFRLTSELLKCHVATPCPDPSVITAPVVLSIGIVRKSVVPDFPG